ncbi:MAG: hypothetical protein ACKO3T_28070, partial [Planctomycetaceae bacterium]
ESPSYQVATGRTGGGVGEIRARARARARKPQKTLLVLVLSPPWRTVLVLEKRPLTAALRTFLRGFA